MSTVSFTRIALAAAVLAGIATLSGCGRSSAATQPAGAVPEVLTTPAKAADPQSELRLPARAEAGESAKLYARATGFVSERRVDLGDHVTAGQVLATIATPEVDQAVREAAADLELAQANQALAKANFDRADVLVGSGAISRELHSERLASLSAARAATSAAQARLSSARERQGFQVVRAPFDGVVVARNVERGDRVVGDSASATLPMFEVNALDPLRIVVDVPQNAALQVRPGMPGQMHFLELADQDFDVEVVRSAQNISSSVGAMRIELRLPNPEGRIPAGMLGEVVLKVPRAAPAVLVPVSAVAQDANGAQVAVVGGDALLQFRKVVLGRNLGNEAEVLSGLKPGEQVVLAPNAMLVAGQKVGAKVNAPAKK